MVAGTRGKFALAWGSAIVAFMLLAPPLALGADGPGQKLFFTAYGLQKAGKLSEAVAVYEAGLKSEPKNATAHYFLGDIYAQLGNGAVAKFHLSLSLKLEPQGQYAAKAQERLTQLSQGPVQNQSKPVAPGTVFRDCPDCPEMVVIPAGSFVMGSPPSEAGHQDSEAPTHTVTIGQPFALAKVEVTRGQFAAFVSETGYQPSGGCNTFEVGKAEKRQDRNWQYLGFQQEDSHPAVCLGWNDAKAYVDWLTRKSGKPYRLPTEAEWEYAARSGTTTARHWGEIPDQACAFANTLDSTTKAQISGVSFEPHNCSDGFAYTSPVGSFRANDFGLHDMIGNAGEWVEDCWNETYNGAPTNGSAWMAGNCERHVSRGGSWATAPIGARSASRGWVAGRHFFMGFRPARMLP